MARAVVSILGHKTHLGMKSSRASRATTGCLGPGPGRALSALDQLPPAFLSKGEVRFYPV